MDHEIAHHEAVINAVNQTITPNAKNAELKALLVKSDPVLLSFFLNAASFATALTVTIRSMKFDPETLQISAGDTVTFNNDGLVPHSVSSKNLKKLSFAAFTPPCMVH